MKAIILSGGRGTRLSPLTDKKPKPLVTVGDRSILDTLLENLSKKGIDKAALTLAYRGEDIKNALGEEKHGIKLCYFTEEKPLGTAGAVKNCESFADDDFLVISGDSVCDVELEQALFSHKRSGALATMILTPCTEPLEYGVVLLDKNGQVKGFSEKPSWEGVKSDLVNCGIYIFNKKFLSLIPENTECDLSGDIFPKMLSQALPINTYVTHSYWCDVGSFQSLYTCNMKTLKSDFFIRYSAKNVTVDTSSRVKDSVVGEGTKITKNACLTRAVVGRDCEIGEGAVLVGCIVGDRVKISKGAKIEKGAVIGHDSYIGEKEVVGEKKRLACDTRLETDAALAFSSELAMLPDGDIVFSSSQPETAFSLGRASTALGSEIGVVHSGTPLSHLSAETFALGVAWSGGECVMFCEGDRKSGAFAAGSFSLPTFVFEENDGKVHTLAYSSSSLPLSRKESRRLSAAFERPEEVREQGSIRYFDGLEFAEREHFKRLLGDARDSDGKVGILNNGVGKRVFRLMGRKLVTLSSARTAEDFFIEISPDRQNVSLSFSRRTLDTEHVHALILKSLISGGRDTFTLPETAPEALDVVARAHGAKIIRTYKNMTEVPPPSLVFSDLWARDALFCTPLLYKVLEEHSFSSEKLSKSVDALPVFLCVERHISTHGIPVGRLMRELEKSTQDTDLRDGIRLSRREGEVRITPEGREKFKILAEAGSAETAEELCGFANGLIEELIKKG